MDKISIDEKVEAGGGGEKKKTQRESISGKRVILAKHCRGVMGRMCSLDQKEYDILLHL